MLCRVSGRVVRLPCSRWGLLFGFVVHCCVPWCAVSLGAVLRRVAPPCVVLLCTMLFCFAHLVPLLAVSCPRALSVALGPSSAVFSGVSLRCVLCAVFVLPWCGGACSCSLLSFVLWLFWALLLCVSCPPRWLPCCAALCWCASAVLFVWSALIPAPGAVVPCCVLCCCLWCGVARCWVWLSAVVFWWPVSVSMSLSGHLTCFPVVGVVCCGALLPCAVFCGAVLLCVAVLLCSAVFFWCYLFLLSLLPLKNRCTTCKKYSFLLFLFFEVN